MNLPKLRLHATGQWFVTVFGKNHYLGVDRELAGPRYLSVIEREYLPRLQARSAVRITRRRGADLTIVDLAERYLTTRMQEGLRPATVHNYRWLLAPLLHAYGPLPAVSFDAALLRALMADLGAARHEGGRRYYSPKSLRHVLNTVRMLFRWGRSEGLLIDAEGRPVIMDLSVVRSPRLPAPRPRVQSPHQIRSLLARLRPAWRLRASRPGMSAHRADRIAAQCRAWCALAYLAALRPTEVFRLVHGQGDWLGHGVFRFRESKTETATGTARVTVLSEEALAALSACRPVWRRPDGLTHAVNKALGPCGWPHALRHSAATQLRALGVPEADVRSILGHQVPGALRHYVRTEHERLRRAVARLSVRFAAPGSAPPDAAPEAG